MAVLLVAGTLAFSQVESPYDLVLTLGSAGGVNPPQRLNGRAGRLAFGKPDRAFPLVTPVAAAVDLQERVWVSDAGAPGVHLFDFPRRSYRFISGVGARLPFQCPCGIDTDSHGRIYVADACSGHVFVFDADASFLRLLVDARKERRLQRPGALLVSGDLKSIYIADPPSHRVLVINQEGETVREIGRPGELEAPTALAVWEGLLYVLDSERGRVQVFSPGGTLQRTLTWEGVRQPSALAIEPQTGTLFLADPAHQVVRAYDGEGKDIGAFGLRGPGPSGLQSLAYLYIDPGRRIYVVDSQGAKVVLFREAARNVALPLARAR